MKRFALMMGIAFAAMNFGTAVSFAQSPPLSPTTFKNACTTAANNESSPLRGGGKTTKMWCALVDREGRLLLIVATDTGGTPQNPLGSDAWRGSIEIAIAKAYTAVAFSSNDLALDSRAVGLASRMDAPGTVPGDVGMDDGPAPLWGISASNPFRSTFGFGQGTDDFVGAFHHGIITFAGGQPVYSKPSAAGCGGGVLLGAVGVSGDGVDQDDAVAKNTVTGPGSAGFCLKP